MFNGKMVNNSLGSLRLSICWSYLGNILDTGESD